MHPDQVIEIYMSAVQQAVFVSNQIERLQADTVMAIVDQLTPYSNGGLAVYGDFIDRERLSRIATEYGTGYARFVLLTALFFAHDRGGYPAQARAIHDIAGSPRCPGEPPQLSSDLDKLMDSARNPEGLGLAEVFIPQVIGAAFRAGQA
jgi:hypothetical protein